MPAPGPCPKCSSVFVHINKDGTAKCGGCDAPRTDVTVKAK